MPADTPQDKGLVRIAGSKGFIELAAIVVSVADDRGSHRAEVYAAAFVSAPDKRPEHGL